MKKFVNTSAGEAVEVLAPGAEKILTYTAVEMPKVVYNYNQIAVIAWVQDDDTKEVINANATKPVQLAGYADLGVVNKSVASGGLCEFAFTPKFQVTNPGSIEVSDYMVELYIDGKKEGELAGQTIAPGETKDISFPEIMLGGGNNSVEFFLRVAAGDIASLNNFSSSVTVPKAGDIAEDYLMGYESEETGRIASNSIVNDPLGGGLNFRTVDATYVNASNKIGGFGSSDKSLVVNFWQWDPANVNANGSLIVADRIVVPTGAKLSFDHAFTTWGGSNDRLEVQVSKDCGLTFTTLFNKAGATLRTAPELNQNNAYFKPTAAQWKENEVDLANYVGETIMVRIKVTSAWGDMLYIDNINVSAPNSVEDLLNDETLSIFPNPASDLINFELNTNASDNITYSITDAVGRVIKKATMNKTGNTFLVSENVSNLNNGLYFVKFNVGNRQITERFNVIK
jgi:hypothetical protein